MGLSWQQGPLGRDPNGAFVTATPMPERVLFIEPLRRRMSVVLAGSTTSRHLVVRHDDRVVADTHAPLVLYESGFAPRWYVPRANIAGEALHAIDGEKLEAAPGQNVIAHGPDRNLSVDEIGGIALVGDAGAPGG